MTKLENHISEIIVSAIEEYDDIPVERWVYTAGEEAATQIIAALQDHLAERLLGDFTINIS